MPRLFWPYESVRDGACGPLLTVWLVDGRRPAVLPIATLMFVIFLGLLVKQGVLQLRIPRMRFLMIYSLA
jgi:hypothetical protein